MAWMAWGLTALARVVTVTLMLAVLVVQQPGRNPLFFPGLTRSLCASPSSLGTMRLTTPSFGQKTQRGMQAIRVGTPASRPLRAVSRSSDPLLGAEHAQGSSPEMTRFLMQAMEFRATHPAQAPSAEKLRLILGDPAKGVEIKPAHEAIDELTAKLSRQGASQGKRS